MIQQYLINRKEYLLLNPKLDVQAVIQSTFDIGGKKFNSSDESEFKYFLLDIEEFLKSATFGRDFDYEVELPLVDHTLKTRGVMDLVIYDQDGKIHVYDWKTKKRFNQKSRLNIFDSIYLGKINDGNGAFGDLFNNAKTAAEVQISIYRLILERNFGSARLGTANAVFIDIDISTNQKTEGQPMRAQIQRNINLQFRRSNLVNYFKSKLNIDINELYKKQGEAMDQIKDIIYDLSGKQNFDEFDNPDAFYWKIIRESIRSPYKDTQDQNYFIGLYGARINWLDFGNQPSMYDQISTYYQKNKMQVNDLAENFVRFFETEKWHGQEEKARNLLDDMHPETHTLQQVKNLPGMESTNDNILVAINKLDGSSKIFSISYKSWATLENTSGKLDRTSVFHKYFSDAYIRSSKYDIQTPLPNKEQYYRMLELGLVAMQLKQLDYIQSVDSLAAGILNQSTTTRPTVMSMQDILPHLAVLKDLLQDDKKSTISGTAVLELLDDDLNMNPSFYQVDAVKFVQRFMNRKLTGDLEHLNKESVKRLQEKLEKHSKNQIGNDELAREMIQMSEAIAAVIKKKVGTELSRKDLLKNREYVALSRATLALLDFQFNYQHFRQQIHGLANFRTMSRTADDAVQYMHGKINNVQSVIKSRFAQFKTEHDVHMKALEKETNITIIKRGISIDINEYFQEMFEHKGNTFKDRKSDPLNSYVLKDPETNNTLGPAQKDYIRFFNNTMLEFLKLTLPAKDFALVIQNGDWKLGMVPLLEQTGKSMVREQLGLWNKVKGMWTQSLDEGYKIQEEDSHFKNLQLLLDRSYQNQFGHGAIENRHKKLAIVQLGDIWEVQDTAPKFEENLELLLNRFVRDSLEKVHYEETLGAYNALATMMMLEEKYAFVENTSIRKYLDEMVKMVVLNEHKKEGRFAQVLDQMNKYMTIGALGLSFKQLLLEQTTMSVSTITSLFAQSLRGNQAEFSAVGFSKGMAQITKDGLRGIGTRKRINADTLTASIINSFGLYNADSEGLVRDEHLLSRGGSLWQSKNMYAWLMYPHKIVTTAGFIAMMDQDGVLPAITADGKGTISYDYTKDKRYELILDNSGKIKKSLFNADGVLKDSLTEQEKFAYLLFEYHQKELTKENKVDANGMPNFPYTAKAVDKKLDLLMHIYGTMDKRGKTRLSVTSFGRLFSKFKNWMAPKIENYWTPRHLSQFRGGEKIIIDSQGNEIIDFVHSEQEGIIQTLLHLSKGVYQVANDENYTLKNLADLDSGRKNNLAKLTSDIVMFTLLTILFSMLFDDEDEIWKTPGGQLMMMTIMNSLGDIAIWKIGDSMISGSPIAAFSYMQRLLQNAGSIIAASSVGDFEKGNKYARNMFGMTKSLNLFDGWE